ncbi:hypothetical protein DPMN_079352 [Dreissena polymorpha]|uniref:Uncharacterized protein n=1 Tax=Dreissena polymorpha TaxID=45954 RepID=A0A9D4BR61_DREPO|nr:hypothetical protein DPMN_079352 [Dreissena polymorpha]
MSPWRNGHDVRKRPVWRHGVMDMVSASDRYVTGWIHHHEVDSSDRSLRGVCGRHGDGSILRRRILSVPRLRVRGCWRGWERQQRDDDRVLRFALPVGSVASQPSEPEHHHQHQLDCIWLNLLSLVWITDRVISSVYSFQ